MDKVPVGSVQEDAPRKVAEALENSIHFLLGQEEVAQGVGTEPC
jgi:hypothetical protein